MRMEIPMPHEAEHSDHGDQREVLQTPTPSPPSSTVAESWLMSSESSVSVVLEGDRGLGLLKGSGVSG